MNGLAIFAPVAPVCSTASFVLLESSGRRDRVCASVSGLDTPEAFLFKSLFSEWHRLMTHRGYVMFWIPYGICCSHSSHLDALWQHFLFILQWYPACTQIPASQFCSGEVWATTCLLQPRCVLLVALCQPAGCSKGEQLFRDGDCGSGRLCTSRGSMESSSKLSFCWISCRKTVLHMLPFPGRWGWRRARSLLCTGTICLFLSLSPPTDESVAQTWSLFLPLSYKLA